MSSETTKPATDWERIERDYRAGVKTLRQIADEHSITHGAINKRAKRDGWERDLSGKIAAKAEALVSRAEVSKQVSTESKAAEREVVDANAQAIADAILAHRKDIRRNRSLANKLLAELEAQTGDVELFAELSELMHSSDSDAPDKLNELYRKVISLPSRIDSAKKLAETLRVTIALEREAYGMDKLKAEEAATTELEAIKTDYAALRRSIVNDKAG